MLLLSLAALAGASQAKFTFSVAGQAAGTATLTSTKLTDGGSQFIVDLHVSIADQTMHQRQEDSYDKNAKPTVSAWLSEQGQTKTEIKLEYGYATLTVTTATDGKVTKKVVRLPMGKSIVRPSQLWFFSVRPERNKISKEIEYNVKTGKWDNHEVVYVGPSSIGFGTKRVTAYELDDKNMADNTVVKELVDAQGMPYRIDFGSTIEPMSMERIAN
jgi:hypothetical protein